MVEHNGLRTRRELKDRLAFLRLHSRRRGRRASMPNPTQLESVLVQAVEHVEPSVPLEDDDLEPIWKSTKTPYSDSALEVRQLENSQVNELHIEFVSKYLFRPRPYSVRWMIL